MAAAWHLRPGRAPGMAITLVMALLAVVPTGALAAEPRVWTRHADTYFVQAFGTAIDGASAATVSFQVDADGSDPYTCLDVQEVVDDPRSDPPGWFFIGCGPAGAVTVDGMTSATLGPTTVVGEFCEWVVDAYVCSTRARTVSAAFVATARWTVTHRNTLDRFATCWIRWLSVHEEAPVTGSITVEGGLYPATGDLEHRIQQLVTNCES